MANLKQQKKRVRTNEIRRQRNVNIRTRMRTYIKQAFSALEAGDAALISKAVPQALSEIDRASSKGAIHRKSAARKKSMLQRRLGAKS